MKVFSASEFAEAAGIPCRTARYAFSIAALGKSWRGHALPVVPLTGQRGGAGGVSYALDVGACTPELRALLGVAETEPSTAVERGHDGCGLAEDARTRIAVALEKTAPGLLAKGHSEREAQRLLKGELQRLTAAARGELPRRQLAQLCNVSRTWVRRFKEMAPVALLRGDHKRFTDRHEAHIRRKLTERPMQALLGDVHIIDLTIEAALRSGHGAWCITRPCT